MSRDFTRFVSAITETMPRPAVYVPGLAVVAPGIAVKPFHLLHIRSAVLAAQRVGYAALSNRDPVRPPPVNHAGSGIPGGTDRWVDPLHVPGRASVDAAGRVYIIADGKRLMRIPGIVHGRPAQPVVRGIGQS